MSESSSEKRTAAVRPVQGTSGSRSGVSSAPGRVSLKAGIVLASGWLAGTSATRGLADSVDSSLCPAAASSARSTPGSHSASTSSAASRREYAPAPAVPGRGNKMPTSRCRAASLSSAPVRRASTCGGALGAATRARMTATASSSAAWIASSSPALGTLSPHGDTSANCTSTRIASSTEGGGEGGTLSAGGSPPLTATERSVGSPKASTKASSSSACGLNSSDPTSSSIASSGSAAPVRSMLTLKATSESVVAGNDDAITVAPAGTGGIDRGSASRSAATLPPRRASSAASNSATNSTRGWTAKAEPGRLMGPEPSLGGTASAPRFGDGSSRVVLADGVVAPSKPVPGVVHSAEMSSIGPYVASNPLSKKPSAPSAIIASAAAASSPRTLTSAPTRTLPAT
mmetsp:Transcript_8710/g.22395  ORF Transcript_8710/g.22395 Transcript_8710/m.22395 type:complete len:401 (+) Transcript_8710:131-1333(+)